MREYSFASKNGVTVTIKVTGSYHDCPDKDLFVFADNGFERDYTEVGNAYVVIEDLEENGVEFDANPRHLNEHVIDACMIQEEETLEQALDYQAKWEAEQG